MIYLNEYICQERHILPASRWWNPSKACRCNCVYETRCHGRILADTLASWISPIDQIYHLFQEILLWKTAIRGLFSSWTLSNAANTNVDGAKAGKGLCVMRMTSWFLDQRVNNMTTDYKCWSSSRKRAQHSTTTSANLLLTGSWSWGILAVQRALTQTEAKLRQ